MTSPIPRFRATDFHPDAKVFTSEGAHVGRLHRVIVNADSWDLRELIVEESRRFSGHLFAPGTGLMTLDLIVPAAAVARVAHDRLDLTITASEARRLPPYLSYEYGPPPASLKEALAGALAPLGVGSMPRSLIETAAKDTSDIEITRGEPIMLGRSGKRLGRVRDVLFDGAELVGIVMDSGGLFSEDVVLQVRFLERSDDAALFARLSPADLEKLKPFHPEDEGA